MKKSRGLFITFEGTEGVGKSTLIRHLSALLENKGYAVLSTREPGGSSVAERIRSIILAQEMDPWTELFLYQAARAEHLAKTVRPALSSGKVVLCDRFTDSTLAYQSHARGLPWKDVVALNRAATQGLKPDLTVWIDMNPAVGLKRATDQNRFEAEGLKFQVRVRQGFARAMKGDPKRWLKMNSAKLTPEQLSAKVFKSMTKHLRLRA